MACDSSVKAYLLKHGSQVSHGHSPAGVRIPLTSIFLLCFFLFPSFSDFFFALVVKAIYFLFSFYLCYYLVSVPLFKPFGTNFRCLFIHTALLVLSVLLDMWNKYLSDLATTTYLL